MNGISRQASWIPREQRFDVLLRDAPAVFAAEQVLEQHA
jgi:hypothetical protein